MVTLLRIPIPKSTTTNLFATRDQAEVHMPHTEPGYHSYLLRLWQVLGEEGPGWRASLEDVQTRELYGFQDLEALLGYLEALAVSRPPTESGQTNKFLKGSKS